MVSLGKEVCLLLPSGQSHLKSYSSIHGQTTHSAAGMHTLPRWTSRGWLSSIASYFLFCNHLRSQLSYCCVAQAQYNAWQCPSLPTLTSIVGKFPFQGVNTQSLTLQSAWWALPSNLQGNWGTGWGDTTVKDRLEWPNQENYKLTAQLTLTKSFLCYDQCFWPDYKGLDR